MKKKPSKILDVKGRIILKRVVNGIAGRGLPTRFKIR